MTDKIYEVIGHGGYYEDAYEQCLKAFPDYQRAQEYKQAFEENNEQWLEKAYRIMDEFEGKSYHVNEIQMEIDMRILFCSIEEVEFDNGDAL